MQETLPEHGPEGSQAELLFETVRDGALAGTTAHLSGMRQAI
jgi:hypothetical protein